MIYLLCFKIYINHYYKKIYRGGAEVGSLSRSRYYNKNYGYPSTSDEGYFFSGTVDNYEFYPVEITIPENFIEFRGFFRDWQSVHCVILFFLTARLYRIYIMLNLMKSAVYLMKQSNLNSESTQRQT